MAFTRILNNTMIFLTKYDWNIWILCGAPRIFTPRISHRPGCVMSKKFPALLFIAIYLIFLSSLGSAHAAVGPKNGDTWVPAPAAPAPVDKDPLTVADMVVDKTAANSVAARDQAIADAPALAFHKLAERNMTDKQLKSLKTPKNVSSLVQDLEIKNEHMSSTRYVAKFTVRFSDAVRNYIDIRETPVASVANAGQPDVNGGAAETDEGAGEEDENMVGEEPAGTPDQNGVIWNDASAKPVAPTAPAAPASPPAAAEALGHTVLILPYYEDMAGQTVLWEDPNPWRRIWQNALPSGTLGKTQLVVPLGDVDDISAGPANAVWSGDYGPVEKLRQHYNADEVLLLAANKSGSSMTVDVYSYHEGHFRHTGSITPFVGEKTEVEAFRQALADTLRYLSAAKQSAPAAPHGRHPSLETISHEVTREAPTTVVDGSTPPGPARMPGTLILKPYGAPQPYAPPLQQPMPQPAPYAAPYYVAPAAPAPMAPPPAAMNGGRAQLSATARFGDFRSWMELQKRLSSMSPMVGVDIRSINSNSAEVTLSYSSSLEALRGELATRGVALSLPPSPGSTAFSLQLAN